MQVEAYPGSGLGSGSGLENSDRFREFRGFCCFSGGREESLDEAATTGDSSRGEDLQTIVLRIDELGIPERLWSWVIEGDRRRVRQKEKEVATAAIAEKERRTENLGGGEEKRTACFLFNLIYYTTN